MSERHASASELELYVIEALDPIAAAAIESHVALCEACAALLAREARLEMAFEQVATASVRPAAITSLHARRARAGSMFHRSSVAVACALGGAVSLAAAWLLWISPGGAPSGDHGLGAGSPDVAAHAHQPTFIDDASGTTASLDARLRDVLDGG